jgi:hypothetical protein
VKADEGSLTLSSDLEADRQPQGECECVRRALPQSRTRKMSAIQYKGSAQVPDTVDIRRMVQIEEERRDASHSHFVSEPQAPSGYEE